MPNAHPSDPGEPGEIVARLQENLRALRELESRLDGLIHSCEYLLEARRRTGLASIRLAMDVPNHTGSMPSSPPLHVNLAQQLNGMISAANPKEQ